MSNRRLLLGLSNGIIGDGKLHRLYDPVCIKGIIQTGYVDRTSGLDGNTGLGDQRDDTFLIKEEDIQFDASNFKTVTDLNFTYRYKANLYGGTICYLKYHFNENGNVIKTTVDKGSYKQNHSGLYKEDIELINQGSGIGTFLTITLNYNQELESATTDKFYYKVPVIYNKTKNLTHIPYYKTFTDNGIAAVRIKYYLNGDTAKSNTFTLTADGFLGDYVIRG